VNLLLSVGHDLCRQDEAYPRPEVSNASGLGLLQGEDGLRE